MKPSFPLNSGAQDEAMSTIAIPTAFALFPISLAMSLSLEFIPTVSHNDDGTRSSVDNSISVISSLALSVVALICFEDWRAYPGAPELPLAS